MCTARQSSPRPRLNLKSIHVPASFAGSCDTVSTNFIRVSFEAVAICLKSSVPLRRSCISLRPRLVLFRKSFASSRNNCTSLFDRWLSKSIFVVKSSTCPLQRSIFVISSQRSFFRMLQPTLEELHLLLQKLRFTLKDLPLFLHKPYLPLHPCHLRVRFLCSCL